MKYKWQADAARRAALAELAAYDQELGIQESCPVLRPATQASCIPQRSEWDTFISRSVFVVEGLNWSAAPCSLLFATLCSITHKHRIDGEPARP